ncbi:MAG: hypothetical protein HGGPFJEG_02898 [Ignavibacteria bacterium]|nr:hypothetical protein [Ignavibacteria bacterium]
MKTKLITLFFIILSFVSYSNSISQDKTNSVLTNEYGDAAFNNQNSMYSSGSNNITDANLGGVGLTTVLKNNNSTSTNARAPQGSKRFNNCRYIIKGSEMSVLGTSPLLLTSIGWTWNNPIGAGAPTSQGVTTTGNLRIYIKDTLGTALNLSGTYIDTMGTGFTKVYDGIITIPSGFNEIDIDLPFGGPGTSPYTYTPGNGVIIIYVYKTTDAVLAAANTPTVSCSNSGGNIFTYQSTSLPGAIGSSSNFRPETRFGFPAASCDIRAVVNLYPYKDIEDCALTGPKARFQNVGTTTQTNISVTYRNNPFSPSTYYFSTKVIPSLDPGEYADITFDPLSTSIGFDYWIYSSAVCDANTANDRIEGSYTLAGNSSYGYSTLTPSTYYYANNTSCGSIAPSTPTFYWEDTTGSTSLVVNGVNAASGIFTGTLDDGYWSLGNILPSGDYFRFNGINYDSFFISTNGLIGLTQTNNSSKLDDNSTLSIPSTSAIQPGLFPMWKDFNLSDADVPENRISYKVSGSKLIFTYDKIPNYGAVLPTDYITFQVILETMPGPVVDGIIIYQYNDVLTGSLFIEKYKAYNLGSHTVGIQNAAGTAAISYRRWTGSSLVNAGPLFSSPIAVAFGGNNSALPVELASFISSVSGSNVTLNWSTVREVNNSGFEVERSDVNPQTPVDWKKVGYVSGNGTTNEMKNYSFTDRGLDQGKYNYRLKQIDYNGNFEYFNLANEVIVGSPEKFSLSQNYPNPFNPSTKINYDLPVDANVSLKVYDMTGKEIVTLVNEYKSAGYHTAEFNALNLSTGVYLYRISVHNGGQSFTSEKRMVLIK